MAVGFDLDRLEIRGTPVPIVPDVATTVGGGVNAAVAADGTLAYVSSASGVLSAQRTLVWVDRQGRETPIPAPARAYAYPRLSPDGEHVAVFANDQQQDIWVWDLGRTTLTRVTFDPGVDNYPTWTADGRRVIFSAEGSGARNLFSQAANGTGMLERLTESPNSQWPSALTPDGRRLIFTEAVPGTRLDIMQLELDGARRVTALVHSPFDERNGVVSPDGRWLAYESNESGQQFEISVRPFPEVNSNRWQISAAGGTRPRWTQSGELVFVSLTGALMGVRVTGSTSWEATTPTQLVQEGYRMLSGVENAPLYDVAADGQRFLMIKEGDADAAAAATSLIVVQHWVEELKRLVPVN